MIKVFIADDSLIVCARLIAILKDIEGLHIVGQAQNAVDAERLIKTMQPDVVILDVQMPGGGGLQVLRSVKTWSPAPIVIMVTNHTFNQYREQSVSGGAEYFFDKATEIDQMVDVLSSLTQQRI